MPSTETSPPSRRTGSVCHEPTRRLKATMADNHAENHCSFCQQPASAVHYLMAGGYRVYICDACVLRSSDLLAEDDQLSQHRRL